MAEFFREQLDYILFFYGLAFIILSAVCFILRKNDERLSWTWLGLFGLTHGIHEWIDLFSFNFVLGPFPKAAHILVVVSSFLFLLEFGRSGIVALEGKGPGRWIFIPLLALASLGGLVGYEGLSATIRYFLGFPGGMLAARALKIASSDVDSLGRRWLLAGSYSMFLYAFLGGFLVKYAPFFPASFLNSQIFMQIFGLPPQLLRGCVAVSAAVSIWFYSQKTFSGNKTAPRASTLYIMRPVIALALVIAGGWVLTDFAGKHAKDEEIKEGNLFVSTLSSHLRHEMENAGNMSFERSNSPVIIKALLTRSPEDIKKARGILDLCANKGECDDAPTCYVLDTDRKILLACNNRQGSDRDIDPSLSPAFIRNALSGKSDVYFVTGKVAATRPGYFASSTVRDEEGHIIGAVIVKEAMNDIMANFREHANCFLTDREGTILLSSREDLLFKGLWPGSKIPQGWTSYNGQTGPYKLSTALSEEPLERKFVYMEGQRFLVTRQELGKKGWSIVLLNSTGHISAYRLFSIFTTAVFSLLTIASFAAIYFSGQTAARLKDQVNSRTSELSYSNAMLQLEIKEREEAEKKIEQLSRQRELILKSAGEGIYGVDVNGLTTFVNPAAVKMIGWGAEELIGRSQHEILHHTKPDGTSYPREECRIYAAFRDGRVHHVNDEVFWRKDGTSFPVEYVSTPIIESGVITGAVVVFNDITERREAEEYRHMYTTELEKFAVELDNRNEALKHAEEELMRYREHLEDVVRRRTVDLIKSNERLQREISEKKKVEVELHGSRHFVQRILDTTPNLLYIYDIAENRNIYTNREVAAFLGYSSDEIIRMGDELFKNILHPEDAGPVAAHHKRFASAKDDEMLEIEYRMRHADGQWRWLHSCDVIFLRDPQGEAKQILGVAEDVTEHKIADEILKQSEARFRKLSMEFNTLLDAIPDALMLLSPDMKILWANNSAGKILCRDIASISGQYCYELWQTRPGICDNCAAEKCFSSGRIESSQSMTSDGRFWSVRAFPMKEEDGSVGNVVVLTSDITEKMTLQAEAMRAGQLAALGELAAGVAHEINNPVNSIINYAQVILDENEDAKDVKNEIAPRIIREGERIANIIKSLLSFARDRKEEKRLIKVREVLFDSLSLVEAQLRKDGIRLDVNMPADLPEIFAHAQQIQQVYLNIINNARYALNQKYQGFSDEKKLEIYGEGVTRENVLYVRIRFFDQGTGIPQDIIDKIMNPFFSTKPSGKGTGLGLSISHGIISDHGGRITVDSTEGKFTRVTIDLPAADKEGNA